MAGAVGRPRKNSPRRRGSTAREEILDASAELFTTQGFATTSTHQIADAVGIRQASLYYHFPSKTEIFLTLLTSTVAPSTQLAARFGDLDLPAPMRLWALTAAECRLLLSTRWNVGRLYQLPVASSEEFESYHRQRTQLRQIFFDIAAEIVGADDPRADLPFHIAASVIEMRANDGVVPYPMSLDSLPDVAIMLADAALTVLNTPLPENRVEVTLGLLSQDSE
ncbi:TetR/AcrR family transcriptional regulator [Corynebacterium felinum]|uniref:AcrR family transcriptional regulator n=1 Tax=Corynebacterium felinum TaxID=131318 RepID=A0ABU2B9W1_9CORY|nr:MULTISPECIES: TetR/AcrR family transcriptional regulator [Corynebacterium]MDF5821581.1 TetR/AcrR family transcriptional regulator [Corynebacterium felinum]MDO4761838.1 TetR/AcrR family transcriptional regulator [Corynebacterium sp.]MDR7355061.1 AcrR family transcriptional regulator [Corynebacterium felinum]WJY94413.1 HTH-type transcriptional regulator AcrR [Corynebacterium felinum]